MDQQGTNACKTECNVRQTHVEPTHESINGNPDPEFGTNEARTITHIALLKNEV
jgi:hypothetical protein